ncbi:FitA-like ribbon-helix-helix domain-containing protein, partial [Frankia sp. CpI1-P]
DSSDHLVRAMPAYCRRGSTNAVVTAITIRDVPDSTLAALKVKAAQSGRSLQAYLLDLVTREARTPTLADMMARLDRETQSDVDTSDILAAIDEGRKRR